MSEAAQPLEIYPCNGEAEEALLAELMLHPEFADDFPFLKASDFFWQAHIATFALIADMRAKGETVHPIALGRALAGSPAFEAVEAEPTAYLTGLIENRDPTPRRWLSGYARMVYQLARQREFAQVGEELIQCALAIPPGDSLEAMQARAIGALQALTPATKETTLVAAGDRSAELLERDAAAIAANNVMTGFAELDEKLGGLRKGAMYVPAGRPGMGKSTFVASLARSIASRGDGVLIIATEMSADEMTARVASDHVRQAFNWTLPYSVMLAKGAGVKGQDRLKWWEASEQIRRFPLLIEDGGGKTVADIAADVREARRILGERGQELKVVMIDHIQHVRASRDLKNKTAELTEISNALLALCKAEKLPFVVCAQLNRGVEGQGRESKRPTMADIRESGTVEQDAHAIIMIYRPEYYAEKGEPDRQFEPAKWAEWDAKRLETENILELIVDKTGAVRSALSASNATSTHHR